MHARVWLAALLTVSLAGCAQMEDFDVAAPGWEPGYAWTYDVSSSESFGYGGESDAWQETLRVLRANDTADGRPVYLVAHEQEDVDTLLAFRKSDLRPSYAMDEVLWDCNGPPACVGEIGATDDDAYPFPALKFPLEDGKRWSEGLDPGFALDAEVLGSETIDTAVGEMEAVLVRFSGEFSDVEADESFHVRVVWDIFYAEEIRMVAKSLLRAEGEVTDPDSGVRIEVEASMGHVLSDYTLEATPAMDAWDLWDAFDMDDYASNSLFIQALELPDSGDGEGRLRMQAGQHRLDDADFAWTVTDAAGTTVATGEGMSLDTTVPYGGRYDVQLVASRQGREVAEASYRINSQLEAEEEVQCGDVYLPGLPQEPCPSMAVPVNAGASEATLMARPQGGLISGELRLLDSGGDVVASADDGDAYFMELGSLPVDDYELIFVPREGMEVGVEYLVYVDYS